jgi:hypothetical protein
MEWSSAGAERNQESFDPFNLTFQTVDYLAGVKVDLGQDFDQRTHGNIAQGAVV